MHLHLQVALFLVQRARIFLDLVQLGYQES